MDTLKYKDCKSGEVVDFYPITILQNVIDRDTGETLDEILKKCNHIYLPFKDNSKVLTRRQVPFKYRHRGLWITYISCKGELVTEWYEGDTFDDKAWGCKGNWKQFKSCQCDGSGSGTIDPDALEQIIKNILKDYKFEVDESQVTDIVNNILKNFKPEIDESQIIDIVNNYLTENPPSGDGWTEEQINDLIKKALKDFNPGLDEDKVREIIEQYIKETGGVDESKLRELIQEIIGEIDFTEQIKEEINNWVNDNRQFFEEIVTPIVDDKVAQAKQEILEELQKYLEDNERVIANALARHEQAITELQAEI